MGSSPVTATTRSARERLTAVLGEVLRRHGSSREAPLLVAFSGGSDSCALLAAAARLGWAGGLVAAHLDHGLDAGSAGRARRAAELAAACGCELVSERRRVAAGAAGLEAAARAARYDLLEAVRRRLGAQWVLTAHHRDDQVETVLLRLLFGSRIGGLAAIRERRGTLLRPLLRLRRSELAAAVAEEGWEPVEDPTNGDLRRPRNRLRHRLLPALREEAAELEARVVGVAEAAAGAAAALDARLAPLLGQPGGAGAASIDLAALQRLPAPLLAWALDGLHERAGAAYPPAEAAIEELRRQLARGDRVGCDAGAGWRWRGRGGRLYLERAGREPSPPRPFTYTLPVPGQTELPEAGWRLRVSRRPVAAWMRRGSPRRAALELPLDRGAALTVRSRRPGDRVRPLGCSFERRLKDVLIDRKVPRPERDRLPLLCCGERIAWVPGVTLDHRFRLRPDSRSAWVAELEPLEACE